MSSSGQQAELFGGAGSQASAGADWALEVKLDLTRGVYELTWTQGQPPQPMAVGRLEPALSLGWFSLTLGWCLELAGQAEPEREVLNRHPISAVAWVRRIRRRFPVPDDAVRFQVVAPELPPPLGIEHIVNWVRPGAEGPWARLTQLVKDLFRAVGACYAQAGADQQALRRAVAGWLARTWGQSGRAPSPQPLRLEVMIDPANGVARLDWKHAESNRLVARGAITCTAVDELSWVLVGAGSSQARYTSAHGQAIRAGLRRWLQKLPVQPEAVRVRTLRAELDQWPPRRTEEMRLGSGQDPWPAVESGLKAMADQARFNFSPLGRMLESMPPEAVEELGREAERLRRREQKRLARQEQLRRNMERMAEARRRRQQLQAQQAKAAQARQTVQPAAPQPPPKKERLPVPPVPVRFEPPTLAFQQTALPLTDLRGFWLREEAALHWVSNQCDDLLALPHCRIQRLDYQVRTALRVLGPMRGRALLSDEVGLGKTIEAGLVLKELLTRGMVRRYLVLTVPSLVDQWEEELNDKFNLNPVTTNQPLARADPARFWRESVGVVASLHTLKQPAQLELARTVPWDMLIVDEAHYLRNRQSQAWQAVNALPRRFLLLLTATPVQNSLEDLYNLVTLLQPGQLPSPREFRARFIDPKRPRQPRQPEELRRLLSQVMIRNTRANAGLNLPPRRAQTLLFEPTAEERAFWQEWEAQLRAELDKLSPADASLWGRLLLQAAGSSPAAWADALEKFPNPSAAQAWRQRAVFQASWHNKCRLVLPLTHGEGGVVIFTQFLRTQAALAEALQAAGVPTVVIHGGTPAAQRQPLTEQFRQQGGALLLTHSGTEGRNLQFCHRLVNFDLPWNPMEIEQRIGRLHRIGQQHPVHIYNLVQVGTLQEHLLTLLQEKLNLFELVVGETGLILGERYTAEEFAQQVLQRWRQSDRRLAEALADLGEELAAARAAYAEVQELDHTLFARDYETS